MGDQRDDEQHDENKEQDLRDAARQNGNTGKSQDRRDERDHEKHQGPIKHTGPPSAPVACSFRSTPHLLQIQSRPSRLFTLSACIFYLSPPTSGVLICSALKPMPIMRDRIRRVANSRMPKNQGGCKGFGLARTGAMTLFWIVTCNPWV